MYETYIIQGIQSGAFILFEDSRADEGEAKKEARKLLKDPTFEGDSVRIITVDGELVWDSNNEKFS